MNVLVVDDSRVMRLMLCSFAETLGFETKNAEHGRDALEKVSTQKFDAIFLDWDMPVMNGLDLLKTLRADRAFDRVKVLMITAQNSVESVYRALDAGADDYLMKPVTEEMLTEKLRMLGLVN